MHPLFDLRGQDLSQCHLFQDALDIGPTEKMISNSSGYLLSQPFDARGDEARSEGDLHSPDTLLLIGVKEHTYFRIILRFDEHYDTYDMRVVEDIDYPSINLVTLDNGVVVSIDEHAVVEIFSNKPGSSKVKRIEDPEIKTEMILSKDGANVLFYTANKLYSLKMR